MLSERKFGSVDPERRWKIHQTSLKRAKESGLELPGDRKRTLLHAFLKPLIAMGMLAGGAAYIIHETRPPQKEHGVMPDAGLNLDRKAIRRALASRYDVDAESGDIGMSTDAALSKETGVEKIKEVSIQSVPDENTFVDGIIESRPVAVFLKWVDETAEEPKALSEEFVELTKERLEEGKPAYIAVEEAMGEMLADRKIIPWEELGWAQEKEDAGADIDIHEDEPDVGDDK